MSSTTTTFLAVGGALLAPTLLGSAAAAGVPIPAFVTTAHTAAIASLRASPIVGWNVSDVRQVNHAYLEIQRASIPTRGAVDAAKAFAAFTTDELDELLGRFLDAAAAGVRVAGGFKVITAAALPTYQLPALARVLSGARPLSGTLTALGESMYQAATLKARLRTLPDWIAGDDYAAVAGKACGELAIECDEQGYLITGAPWSAPGEIADSVWHGVTSLPGTLGNVAGRVLPSIGDVLLSGPGLLVGAGVIAYVVLR